MKKAFLISIAAIILISVGLGIFVYFNPSYLGLIFKPKPGNCLILEQKYCDLAKAKYSSDGVLSSITYSLPQNTPIFYPVSSDYSSLSLLSGIKNNNAIFIGKQLVTPGNTNTWYEISFFGTFIKNFKTGQVLDGAQKSKVFAYTKKSNKNEGINLILSIQNISLDDQNQAISSINIDELQNILNKK